jgi:hypothetical protein
MNYLGTCRGKTGYLWPECVGISLQYHCYGFLANAFILNIVAAAIAIAVATVLSTGEALTVQLQTAGVLAIAVLTSGCLGS